MSIRVCVIGAGAGGLNALRHLTAKPHLFQAVAYEQTSTVGGTWVYTDKTGTDENGLPIHSSMYKYMRTNLPKEVMAFPDFPFPEKGPSFIGHEDVLQYLQNYTDHFNLRKYIQFNTEVAKVSPVKNDDPLKTKWNVRVQQVGDKEGASEESQFDAVIVCNGHYSVPQIPDIPGLDTFSGNYIHSHNYRYPENFKGQSVLCLGAGPSGTDIALDLAPYAKQVYLSHRKSPLETPLPNGVQQVKGISSIHNNTVVLSDDTRLVIDTIIFCTGYHYTFPFLDTACHLIIDEHERVSPLYQHLIHTEFPSMSFIGIPKSICPLPLFDCQLKFILAAWTGDMKLPSKAEMDKDTESDFKNRLEEGKQPRFAHTMGPLQWEYNDHLATLAGFEQIPRVVQILYEAVYLSARHPPYKSSLPRNVEQVPGLSHITRSQTLTLDNGCELDINSMIFCTGYNYSFPFLCPKCRLDLNDHRLMPLYKHIVHADYKSLFFIGIPKIYTPFKQMDGQMKFVVSIMINTCEVPDYSGMLTDIASDYQNRLSIGWPHRYAHKMAPLQWAYNRDLAKLGGFDPIPFSVEKLYDFNMDYRWKNIESYKNVNYKLTSDTFIKLPH